MRGILMQLAAATAARGTIRPIRGGIVYKYIYNSLNE